jgi:hypothetical protein
MQEYLAALMCNRRCLTGELLTIAEGNISITGHANVSVIRSRIDYAGKYSNSYWSNANVPVTALAMTATLGTAVLDANSLI